jgi:hypothetical protein
VAVRFWKLPVTGKSSGSNGGPLDFCLIREDHAMTLLAELTDTTPESPEQMLEGSTAEDAATLRERLADWRADEPVGKELI